MNNAFIKSSRLKRLHRQIDTPALLIDEAQLNINIRSMQDLAIKHGVNLRPHFKTHKSCAIAHKQIKAGAKGITVAKTGEAEILAAAGIDDIFIANQVTHPLKFERLYQLNKNLSLTVGIDHPEQIRLLDSFFSKHSGRLRVLVEIDSGLNRCGVLPGKMLTDLVQQVHRSKSLQFDGIFTHAGQVYGAGSTDEIVKAGETEALIMYEAVQYLKQHGFEVKTVSVGSTPTVPYSAAHPIVTEIRPGNYVFYDNIQYILGSCSMEQWSLAILATVISQPAEKRIIIDAGSKALNLDRGAHASERIKGYGKLLNIEGEIVRLSEEHGVIELTEANPVTIGQPVLIIPNHACAVTNLFSHLHFLSGLDTLHTFPVDARGMSQ